MWSEVRGKVTRVTAIRSFHKQMRLKSIDTFRPTLTQRRKRYKLRDGAVVRQKVFYVTFFKFIMEF